MEHSDVSTTMICTHVLKVAAGGAKSPLDAIAVSGDCQDRPFAAMVRGAKAGLQIASSLPATRLACVQRELPLAVGEGTSGRLLLGAKSNDLEFRFGSKA